MADRKRAKASSEQLPHEAFDRPSEEALAPVRASMQGLSDEEISRVYIREVFADLNPGVALAGTLVSWVGLVDSVVQGRSDADIRSLYRDTATRA